MKQSKALHISLLCENSRETGKGGLYICYEKRVNIYIYVSKYFEKLSEFCNCSIVGCDTKTRRGSMLVDVFDGCNDEDCEKFK